MSIFSRRAALDLLTPSIRTNPDELGPHHSSLIEAGLIEPTPKGLVSVPRQHHPLIRLLRSLDRVRIFEPTTIARLEVYLREHFNRLELIALGHGYRGTNLHTTIASRVAGSRWLGDFLDAPDAVEWEWQRSDERLGWRFVSDDLVELTRQILYSLLDQKRPIAIVELAKKFEHHGPRDVFAQAFATTLRYALLFASMRGEDLEPVVSLWPDAARRVRRPLSPAPQPSTEVVQPFESALGVSDFITVLSGSAAHPIRLRSDDLAIYKRDRQLLADRLAPVPEWLTSNDRFSDDIRLDVASWELRDFGLAEIREERHLVPTEKGSKWLSSSTADQLHELTTAIRAAGFENRSEQTTTPRLPQFLPRIVHPYLVDTSTLVAAVVAPFVQLEVGQYFPLEAFLEYRAQVANPLHDWARRRSVSYWHPDRHELGEEELEAAWRQQLGILLFHRLIPFGGAHLGLLNESGTLAFTITTNGHYMLGAEVEFSAPDDRQQGQIFVQPNFEIVFMAPAPAAETQLSRFADRIRSNAAAAGVGVLFRLTRESAYRAAASGLTAEQAISTLDTLTSTDLPQNVTAQLEGWFGGFRHIEVDDTVVIRCGDAETATKALAIGKGAVRALSDTVLELTEPSKKNAYLKALRQNGVFPR